ncbi:hypothetical protein PENCOP_c011G00215 [Penicillium coprophilum]|uniref:Uncharacterized protein n=1 Tax=Penicillium coprophilum TaxID=36646 RepID=A0A1V6UFM5_9EURO|nr:hypothetical protein PENCOP_c011G00215 [Penicillium coprophilum]
MSSSNVDVASSSSTTSSSSISSRASANSEHVSRKSSPQSGKETAASSRKSGVTPASSMISSASITSSSSTLPRPGSGISSTHASPSQSSQSSRSYGSSNANPRSSSSTIPSTLMTSSTSATSTLSTLLRSGSGISAFVGPWQSSQSCSSSNAKVTSSSAMTSGSSSSSISETTAGAVPQPSLSGIASSTSVTSTSGSAIIPLMVYTTPPPGLHTSSITQSLSASNTLLTTTENGRQTIIPVIGGVGIWGIPNPGTYFNIPGFPGAITIPCLIACSSSASIPSTDEGAIEDSYQASSSSSSSSCTSASTSTYSTEFVTCIPITTSSTTTSTCTTSTEIYTTTGCDLAVTDVSTATTQQPAGTPPPLSAVTFHVGPASSTPSSSALPLPSVIFTVGGSSTPPAPTSTLASVSASTTASTTFGDIPLTSNIDFNQVGPKPTAIPFTTTSANGEILAYPSRIVDDFAPEGVFTTKGAGTPVTLQGASPTQISSNRDGSGPCNRVQDSCDKAYGKYVDDTIYSSYTSYTWSGSFMIASSGQAGCAAMFTCENDNYGFGMTGRQIKAAVEYMKSNDGVANCGTTYLSNFCHITLDACGFDCHATR